MLQFLARAHGSSLRCTGDAGPGRHGAHGRARVAFFALTSPPIPPSPSLPPSFPQCRSLPAATALGSVSERCRHAAPRCPGRAAPHLFAVAWRAVAQPPPPFHIYISIYMCIIAVRTKRPAGPRGPGLPLPWLVVGVVSARLPVPLLCVAARGSGPSLSSFRLPQHLSEPGRRRCPSSPLVFSEYLSAPIFCTTFSLSPHRSLPCGSACESSLSSSHRCR